MEAPMRGSVRRQFAGGSISRRAAEKHFNYGTTSDNPVPLTTDDGGNWSGAVGAGQIDDRRMQRAGRGFSNAERDYNPARVGVGHIDERRLQRKGWNGETVKRRPDRSELA